VTESTLCVHATPTDPLYRYVGPDGAWEHELVGVTESLVLVGHTHLQFVLSADGHRVVNPGSVGQPKDGDPRAAYAVATDGTIVLERVAYDIERTIAGLEAGGVAPAAVEALATLLRTGRL
jgi:protein phosphatase